MTGIKSLEITRAEIGFVLDVHYNENGKWNKFAFTTLEEVIKKIKELLASV